MAHGLSPDDQYFVPVLLTCGLVSDTERAAGAIEALAYGARLLVCLDPLPEYPGFASVLHPDGFAIGAISPGTRRRISAVTGQHLPSELGFARALNFGCLATTGLLRPVHASPLLQAASRFSG